jgi:hypothetical protein
LVAVEVQLLLVEKHPQLICLLLLEVAEVVVIMVVVVVVEVLDLGPRIQLQ